MSDLLETGLMVLSSGGLGALAGVAASLIRARGAAQRADAAASAKVAVAGAVHDERIAPALLARITVLEERLDKRDAIIDLLQVKGRDCEAKAAECEQRSLAQGTEIVGLRKRLRHLERQVLRLDGDITRYAHVELPKDAKR